MADKTDEEIIKEVGLENSNDITAEEALEELSLSNDSEENLEPTLQPRTEDIPNNQTSKKEELKSKKNDSEDNNSINIGNDQKEEKIEENTPLQKKQPKIYKILMAVVGFLLLILILGVSLYFLGFFDPEEPKKMQLEKIEMKKTDTSIKFDTKDLNKKRLNKKLTMLTKHEIMNRTELEAEEKRIKEEKIKEKEAEEKAIADKKRIAEEKINAQYEKIEKEKQVLIEQQKAIKEKQEIFLELQEKAAMKLEEKQTELLRELEEHRNMTNPETEPKVDMKEESTHEEPVEEIVQERVEAMEEMLKQKSSNTFSSFINVATIKGELYKEFLDEIQKYNKNLSLCRDDKNRIEIFFGPYDSKKERQKAFDNLLNNGFKESYLIDFTNEEYEKRCKY